MSTTTTDPAPAVVTVGATAASLTPPTAIANQAATISNLTMTNNTASSAPSGTVSSSTVISNGTFVSRTLAAVSADFETAINDVESFINSKESFIQAWIETQVASLKAAAEADYQKVLSEKQALVNSLEVEFTATRSWLSNKWEQIKAVFTV